MRAAPEDVHVAQHDPVGRNLERLLFACETEKNDTAARANESRRQQNRLYRTRSLDHEVERAARESLRGGDRVLVTDVHDAVGSQSSGELELFGAYAVGEERARRVQAGECQRERAERADADHADGLAGARPRSTPRSKHEPGSTRTPAAKETFSGRRCTTCRGTATYSP